MARSPVSDREGSWVAATIKTIQPSGFEYPASSRQPSRRVLRPELQSSLSPSRPVATW